MSFVRVLLCEDIFLKKIFKKKKKKRHPHLCQFLHVRSRQYLYPISTCFLSEEVSKCTDDTRCQRYLRRHLNGATKRGVVHKASKPLAK